MIEKIKESHLGHQPRACALQLGICHTETHFIRNSFYNIIELCIF